MALSLNETGDRVRGFAAGDTSERAECRTFRNEAPASLSPAEKKQPASRKRKTEECL